MSDFEIPRRKRGGRGDGGSVKARKAYENEGEGQTLGINLQSDNPPRIAPNGSSLIRLKSSSGFPLRTWVVDKRNVQAFVDGLAKDLPAYQIYYSHPEPLAIEELRRIF